MRHHLLLLPLVLAACAAAPAAPAAGGPPKASEGIVTHSPDAAMLGRQHWRLAQATDAHGQRIDALFVRADKPLQLDFAQDSLRVSGGCNSMGGDYRIADGQLQVSAMRHTMMACADPALNRLDGQISSRLEGHPAITVTIRGMAPQLELRTSDGDVLTFTGVTAPAQP